MVYGMMRVVLDDFSRVNTHWVPDVESIVLYGSRDERDVAMAEAEGECDEYEAWVPFEKEVIHKAIKTNR